MARYRFEEGVRLAVELEVDELRALADGLRGETGVQAASSSVVWWAILGIIVLAVLAALLVLAGRKRRERGYEDEPSFEGYAVGREAGDDYASVAIEERPAMPWQRVEEPPIDDDAENVVPIRKVAVHEAETGLEPESEEEAEPARYAFAGGQAGGTRAHGRPAEPRGPYDPQPPYEAPRQEASMSREDEARRAARQAGDQPFIAPFIREDIERAERRQAERIETLRDEVSRQFAAMKTEQSSRLDLFVAAVDRKLEGAGGGRTSFGEGDLQRVTEGSVRPVFDRLERLATQLGQQEQRLADLAQLIELRMGDVPSLRADLHETTAMVGTLRERAAETHERTGRIEALLEGQADLYGEIAGLREGMGRLERAILDRASEDGSAQVALSEVVRGTLSDGSYAFSQRLKNGETADCLIRFEGQDARIAIDAGFPMEAFDQLPSRDAVRKNLPQAKAAEDHFRRAILRAILAAADRCIVPGQTVDSCLLFLPSEAAYTTLHDRFGDLVRDAQRARVWLTSPSTLMGTLQLLSNLMPAHAPAVREDDAAAEARHEEDARRAAEDAKRERARAASERREAERRAMREEIKALRERAAGLAGELDRTRGTLSELIDTTEKLSSDDYDGPDWSEDDREDRYED